MSCFFARVGAFFNRALPLALLAVSAVACSADAPEQAKTESALLGRHFEVELAFPSGFDEQNVVLHGSQDVDIGHDVILRTPTDGRPASVGLGDRTLEIGEHSRTGALVSGGDIRVGRGARVEGNAQAQGIIRTEPGGIITGERKPGTPLGALSVLAFSVDFPRAWNAVHVRGHERRVLEPGSFASIDVSGRGALVLRPGTFYIDDLRLRDAARLEIDAGDQPVVIFVRRLLVVDGLVDAAPERLLVGYFGAGPLSLRSRFSGTLVAPNANVALSPVHEGGHRGAFFAKNIDAGGDRHDVHHHGPSRHHDGKPAFVTHVPFAHWDRVVPPKVFVNCVSPVTPERFVALFGYKSSLAKDVTIRRGPDNEISPASARADAAPPETFSPGSHPVAFWVPIDGSGVTWKVRASSATATPTSPSCGSDAWPVPPGSTPRARGDLPSDPSPLAQRSAPYFTSDQPATPTDVGSLVTTLLRAPSPPPQFSRRATVTWRARYLELPGTISDQPSSYALSFGLTIGNTRFDGSACDFSCTGTGGTSCGAPGLVGCFGGNRYYYPPAGSFPPVDDAECVPTGLPSDVRARCVGTESQERDHWERRATFQFFTNQPVVEIPVTLQSPGFSGFPVSFTLDLNVLTCTATPEPGTSGNILELTGNCANGFHLDKNFCWDFSCDVQPEVVLTDPLVCATWNADFIDGERGEDDDSTPVAGTTLRRYPASFASFQLGVAGPMAGFEATTGFLDENGCVPIGAIPKEAFVFQAGAEPELPGGPSQGGLQLLMSVDASHFHRPDGVDYELKSVVHTNPTASLYPTFFEVSTGRPSDIELIDVSQWQTAGGLRVPPARIDIVSRQLSPATDAAATISRILRQPDLGIVPGVYRVFQGTGDVFTDSSGRTYVESNGLDVLNIGLPTPLPVSTPCTVDSNCFGPQQCLGVGPFDSRPCSEVGGGACECKWPDQARWKFTIGHEAGHQVQNFGLGVLPISTYTYLCPPGMTCLGVPSEDPGRPGLVDPPTIASDAPLCGCQHVTASNRLHCLQSIERSSGAQVEGFGQFFASRIWNRQDEANCTFVYYKDFLEQTPQTPDAKAFTAPGGQTLFTHPPPYPVSCLSAHKWRNRHCPMGPEADMSTELDWMAFFYNINSVGDPTVRAPMSDIFRIYKQGCVPPPPTGTPPPANPPLCAGRYAMGWTSTPPSLPLVAVAGAAAVSFPCTTDAECNVLGTPIDPGTGLPLPFTCRDDQPVDSVAPCTDGTCRCKLAKSCTVNTDCTPLNVNSSCREATAGSPLPCPLGGSCICKTAQSCTTDADCPRGLTEAPDQHCRDDLSGFPPCSDGSCVCTLYERLGFENGAELTYTSDPLRMDNVTLQSVRFGVGNDLSP